MTNKTCQFKYFYDTIHFKLVYKERMFLCLSKHLHMKT
ncbi:hypothetical protein FM106_09080 [Brachybacterium faecium]|nr:hypothetical protein FM106_09080 [Brachybacterium faecium]